MPNGGAKAVTFRTTEADNCMLKMLDSDAQKPMNSVSRICDTGHCVGFYSQRDTNNQENAGRTTAFFHEHAVCSMEVQTGGYDGLRMAAGQWRSTNLRTGSKEFPRRREAFWTWRRSARREESRAHSVDRNSTHIPYMPWRPVCVRPSKRPSPQEQWRVIQKRVAYIVLDSALLGGRRDGNGGC